MITTSYDPETDALAVHFEPEGGCVEREEVAPGIVGYFDARGIDAPDVRMGATALSGAPKENEPPPSSVAPTGRHSGASSAPAPGAAA